jgi:hypothetical protein
MTIVNAYSCENYVAVRVRATGAPVAGQSLNIAFLLDASDSMSGERMDSVKRTLHAARPLFIDTDRVTVIAFGDSATTVCHRHVMDEEGLDTFYCSIDAIMTDGCTNLSGALETLHQMHGLWDAVILLTDGHINVGVTSTAGLSAMAQGIGSMPFYTLGYGADHNRILLRDLALTSRGSYTFVDSDEVLPVAMGEMIGGLRTQVLRDVVVTINGDGNYACHEVGGSGSTYRVGSIVADRDYWTVFTTFSRADTVTMTAADITDTIRVVPEPAETDEVREQILRCRVARAMADAATIAERGNSRDVRAALVALQTEIDGLSDSLKARPLVLRMRGQLAGILDELSTPAPALAAVSTRLQSSTVYYTMQRGTQSAGDPDLFCSPVQRVCSQDTRSRYTGIDDN